MIENFRSIFAHVSFEHGSIKITDGYFSKKLGVLGYRLWPFYCFGSSL